MNIPPCLTSQDTLGYAPPSSEDEAASPSQSETEEENEPDGVFTFKRRKHTNYHAVSDFTGTFFCHYLLLYFMIIKFVRIL